MDKIIEKLYMTHDLDDNDFITLLSTDKYDLDLYKLADRVRKERYGTDVYLRGLIEFTNYCKNNCYYCGIRHGNKNVERYRMTKDEILTCCNEGYRLGYRTFVLQGGEDPYYSDDLICDIVSSIKTQYSDCAITLSIGEKSYESYLKYYESGADRYLLRHESANPEHYSKLHPKDMNCDNRKRCLYKLKEIGYQIGAGIMVGSPYQTLSDIVYDIRFLQELLPDMIGIGPYLTHKDTPFKSFQNGDIKLTLRLVSILRLIFPYALIPSTTALGTINPRGRELGLLAGANVVMPNLTSVKYRKKYELYDNKICTGEESAQCRTCLERRVSSVGYNIVTSRGDVKRR